MNKKSGESPLPQSAGITENGWSWKEALDTIQPNPLDKAGSPRAGCTG